MAEPVNILVVDDEKGIREGCRRILSSEGFNVDTAENGKLGLEKAKENSFDLDPCRSHDARDGRT